MDGEPLWPTVLVGTLREPYKFQLIELPAEPVPAGGGSASPAVYYVAWRWTNASSAADPVPTPLPELVTQSAPLVLAPVAHAADFAAYYMAPLLGAYPVGTTNGSLALLGEWSKWAPVSRNRISRLEVTAATAQTTATLTVHLMGLAGETVGLAVATPDLHVTSIQCAIGVLQTAVVTVIQYRGQVIMKCSN